MGFLDWLFGRNKSKHKTPPTEEPAHQPNPDDQEFQTADPTIETQTFQTESGAFGIGTIQLSGDGIITIGLSNCTNGFGISEDLALIHIASFLTIWNFQ